MQNINFVTTLMDKYLNRYIKSNKAEKSKILDELELTTKLHRKSLIRSFTRKQFTFKGRTRGGSLSTYHPEIFGILDLVWEASDYICAERLSPEMENTVSELTKYGYLEKFNLIAIEQVKKMPLGTLKLKLKKLPRPIGLTVKHRSGKSDLRRIIPVNTKQGDAVVCGHLEMDFVDHNGGESSGIFGRSFSIEDVKTQWHNKYAVLGKTYQATHKAFKETAPKMPFKIRSLHSDNEPGLLLNISNEKNGDLKLKISRSRPYQKEDNGHVEQKNGDKIRGLVGYWRYDRNDQIELLNKIYYLDDLIQNFFIASMRLIKKEYNEEGKLIRKVYDEAKTPYTRVLAEKSVGLKKKQDLINHKSKINRLELIRERNKMIRKLKTFG
jgi:hypothetical protein